MFISLLFIVIKFNELRFCVEVWLFVLTNGMNHLYCFVSQVKYIKQRVADKELLKRSCFLGRALWRQLPLII